MQNRIDYKKLNIEVYEDTAERCRTNARLRESIERSIREQKFTGERENIIVKNRKIFTERANIIVSQKRTLEAAKAYANTKVAVLNFASASHPGGGVTTGAGAQEESICRCSTLHQCFLAPKMEKQFYEPHWHQKNALHDDDCIYTPGVTVIKTDTSAPELLDESDWYNVDVITCAAPNLRNFERQKGLLVDKYGCGSITDKGLKQLHIKRLRRILDIAISNKVESIILGAFGCGAFMNDPRIVADATAEAIKDYLHAFKNIEFAVFCRPGFEQNYKEFSKLREIGL
ncbi:TIGR02452 family protein [Fibrobacter sp. UWB2]|uniref:TIGR02452 family protein n=1 Tax=Fibrobacter sp. UWB2 TaxID=1964358 RepID=UPI000B51ED3E|nr:TIGR02452 family protein [Fibrobacter sp. UWB2]OWV21710.1 TIGR02452 family protein [Fibrobacter sp. UWB2]